jgi:ferredoxin-NADP reductase
MEKFHWQLGRVTRITQETPRVKTFTLALPHWRAHRAGQHYDLRLTAADGYQAQRSYSVASPPEQAGEIALTVDLLAEGEVSTYLHEGVAVGDELEVRGPIGGYFVWGQELADRPLLLVAGGSGVVPLMAMLRHRAALGATNSTTLLFSVRTADDVIYGAELEQLALAGGRGLDLRLTYTRQAPPGWAGYRRRIDRPMLAEVLSRFPALPECFICGPTPLVEQVASALLEAGLPAGTIRTERFGPS